MYKQMYIKYNRKYAENIINTFTAKDKAEIKHYYYLAKIQSIIIKLIARKLKCQT